MKKTLIFISFLISSVLSAQNIEETWMKENYTKTECYIPMRDGVKLYTAIYAPKNTDEKHPILLTRTPYSCSPYGENNYERVWSGYMKEYLKEGYIYIKQDVRGRYMSQGVFVDIRPYNPNKKKKEIDEASDSYDTVEWLLKNIKNNNGKVGVFGNSYNGFYALMAAKSKHPNIVAVSPQAPATDWYMGDDFHRNGAFVLNDSFRFYAGFGKPHYKPTTGYPSTPRYYEEDEFSFFKKQKTIKNLSRLFGDSIRFWKEILEHPDYDKFWQDRDARRHCDNIKAAVLIVGGFFDAEDSYGAFNLHRAIQEQSPSTSLYLVGGPWDHGGWRRNDTGYLGNIRFRNNTCAYFQNEIEIPFFNYYLKGKGDITNMAKATIYYSGSDSWKKYNRWPLPEKVETPLYLTGKGGLSFSKPTEENSVSTYISDPEKPVPYTAEIKRGRPKEYMTEDQRFVSSRPDVLTFVTPVLENDVTVAGEITASLDVSITTSDADFIVKVIDVFPDNFNYDEKQFGKGNNKGYLMNGYQMLVRGDVMRGRYRTGFDSPSPFEPNEKTNVTFKLVDVAHTFRQGHRIQVQIQSSWFPLIDRNPQQYVPIYSCEEKDYIPTQISIYHSNKNASYISLPIIKENFGNN